MNTEDSASSSAGDSAADSPAADQPSFPPADRPADMAQPVSGQSPPSPGEDVTAAAAGDTAATTAPPATTEDAGQEEIDEYEPLTPELVEEEALRGDFVLKWAVVLLAFLMGATHIAETGTLLQIKTGQYLAGHGLLPPAQDVFSYTADDRAWVNLSWGQDLLWAGLYQVAGFGGISCFKALVGAVIFGLVVHISRPGLPTWWGAVCAAVALIACNNRLTAQPILMSLLGVALMLFVLNVAQQPFADLPWSDSSQRTPAKSRVPVLWWLVPIFMIWANCDHKAFLGLLLLLLYNTGSTLAARFRPGQGGSPEFLRTSWLVTLACFGASFLHPWGWHVLGQTVSYYTHELPAFQNYIGGKPNSAPELLFFNMGTAFFWENLDASAYAGLFLLAVTAILLYVNAERLEWGHLFVYVGFAIVAALAVYDLAVTSLVCAVLATLNGQSWYQAEFRQTYSVDPRELLFSRGGRALTVIAFAAIALFAGTGRLHGSHAPRTGFGLDSVLQSHLDSLRELLADSFDDRPFNFAPTQGNMLIWLDQKVFIDTRLSLYSGTGDQDLIRLHKALSISLRGVPIPQGASLEPVAWPSFLDKYDVTHVVARLTGNNPDYPTVLHFLNKSKDWQLTAWGAAAAVFYRKQLDDPELTAYLKKPAHQVKFFEQVFVQGTKALPQRDRLAQPPSFYKKYLWPRRRELSNALQLANHNIRLASDRAFPPEAHQDRLALVYLAIQQALAGLSSDPDAAEGYIALAQAYANLVRDDVDSVSMTNRPYSHRRYLQAVNAYSQSLVCEPNNLPALMGLFQLYIDTDRLDLAQRSLKSFLDHYTFLPGSREEKQFQAMTAQLSRLEQEVTARQDRLRSLAENNVPLLQRAQVATSFGLVAEALQLVEEFQNLGTADPETRLQTQFMRLGLLLEVGRLDDAVEIATMHREDARLRGQVNTIENCFFTDLASGNYELGLQFVSEHLQQMDSQQAAQLIFSAAPRNRLSPTPWPLPLAESAFSYLFERGPELAAFHYHMALTRLETGEPALATQHFRKILEAHPDFSFRAVVVAYLKFLTGKDLDPLQPSENIPILFEDPPAN